LEANNQANNSTCGISISRPASNCGQNESREPVLENQGFNRFIVEFDQMRQKFGKMSKDLQESNMRMT
jgi:hypothetical protein